MLVTYDMSHEFFTKILVTYDMSHEWRGLPVMTYDMSHTCMDGVTYVMSVWMV